MLTDQPQVLSRVTLLETLTIKFQKSTYGAMPLTSNLTMLSLPLGTATCSGPNLHQPRHLIPLEHKANRSTHGQLISPRCPSLSASELVQLLPTLGQEVHIGSRFRGVLRVFPVDLPGVNAIES